MFAYQTKINEKDALVFNKGGQKEDNAEVLALVEGNEGKLELVNGLLSDGDILSNIGNVSEAFSFSDEGPRWKLISYIQHLIDSHEIEVSFEDEWFNSNYDFSYDNIICKNTLLTVIDETTLGLKLDFGDNFVAGEIEIVTDEETGSLELVCGDFCLNGDELVVINDQVYVYTKNLPVPEVE